MAVTAGEVAIDATGEVIAAHGSSLVTSSHAIRNTGSTTIYLGGSGVTSAAGFPLDPGQTVSVTLSAGESLYGITIAGSTGKVRVLGITGL